MSLFNNGRFTLHSGAQAEFLIDCQTLVHDDLAALASEIERRLGPFGIVEGVPQGGLPLAGALRSLSTGCKEDGLLIVDDVLTTGASMEEQRDGRQARGVVIFARGPCPDWIRPLFQMEQW